MNAVTKQSLIALIEAGDLLGLAIGVNKALLSKHFPHLEYAVLMGGFAKGRAPDLSLTIIAKDLASAPLASPEPEPL